MRSDNDDDDEDDDEDDDDDDDDDDDEGDVVMVVMVGDGDGGHVRKWCWSPCAPALGHLALAVALALQWRPRIPRLLWRFEGELHVASCA